MPSGKIEVPLLHWPIIAWPMVDSRAHTTTYIVRSMRLIVPSRDLNSLQQSARVMRVRSRHPQVRPTHIARVRPAHITNVRPTHSLCAQRNWPSDDSRIETKSYRPRVDSRVHEVVMSSWTERVITKGVLDRDGRTLGLPSPKGSHPRASLTELWVDVRLAPHGLAYISFY